MKLLPEDKLIWSPIVVNSRMNRERNASGVNNYEQEFNFKPEEYLEKKIKENGSASWLDLCCGQGNALMQTANYFHRKGLQDVIRLEGIDLIDTFPVIDPKFDFLQFKVQSLVEWKPAQKYDLVTCVHGLHYLGDKLKVLEQCTQAITEDGLFIANLDLRNFNLQGEDTEAYLKKTFKQLGFLYNAKSKILKRTGYGEVKFDFTYLGASDEHGPNYTGQDSVTSYYSIS
ncbi:MAG: methyltransferase domain-containing protein [Bacteroidetes bacterium]|nr:methyltransferase domain-containing protein [Bacteroidota bacterium]